MENLEQAIQATQNIINAFDARPADQSVDWEHFYNNANNAATGQAVLDAMNRDHAREDFTLTNKNALKRAALWYAEQGISIFPLTPNTKTPLTSNGFHAATTDPDQILSWWTTTPNANIGIATGPINGFDVIDIDGAKGYYSWLIDPTFDIDGIIGKVVTPRGLHFYIPTLGEDEEPRGIGTEIWPGVDLRGKGGYVVAPPSHIAHNYYAWDRPLTLDLVSV
jgi:hypothetical protein